MFDVRYKGFRLIPSRSAAEELIRYGLMLEDCKEVLENGYQPRKRGKDTVERWLDSGQCTYNVVVVLSYNFMYKEDVWLIKHVGKFTKKRIKWKTE